MCQLATPHLVFPRWRQAPPTAGPAEGRISSSTLSSSFLPVYLLWYVTPAHLLGATSEAVLQQGQSWAEAKWAVLANDTLLVSGGQCATPSLVRTLERQWTLAQREARLGQVKSLPVWEFLLTFPPRRAGVDTVQSLLPASDGRQDSPPLRGLCECLSMLRRCPFWLYPLCPEPSCE